VYRVRASNSEESPMTTERGLLRRRTGHEPSKVSFVELFFDLVFVFAVTQLSHSLIEHFSLAGALQLLLLLLAVWWVWIYTAWVTNWLDPEKLPVRLALMVLMLLGLILSASIPRAFESHGLAFACAYACMQVGRSVFFIWAAQGHPGLVRNFQRILAWLALGGVFWIAGGLAHENVRLGLWSLALAVEYVAPWVGFHVPGLGRSTTSDWDVEGRHMSERCALFIIIALGESILVTGATFSGLAWTGLTLAAFIVSFVASAAMWWLYFDTSAEFGTETIAGSRDPGRVARLTYTYVHLFLVAGIVLAAVADEFVLAHPAGHTETKVAIAVLGGAALYVVGITLFKWTITGGFPVSHLVALVGLALMIPAAPALSPLALSAAATVVLVALAAWERRTRHLCPQPPLVRD
jgi:low temperature requirement protein LtrA